jgi:hypothetical protein
VAEETSDEPTKLCTKCGVTKAHSQFTHNKNKKFGVGSLCKQCARNYEKQRCIDGYGRTRDLRNRGADAPRGVPILPPKGQRCDLCGTSVPGANRDWCKDHDHDSGALRGWLCRGCNNGLGHLKDSPRVLAGALRYLHFHGKALTTDELVSLFSNLHDSA